jgi:hypothetical protein
MSTVALIGDRATVDAFLRTREGRQVAREVARAILRDDDRLALHETGLDDDDLPPAVAVELARLIAARNRGTPHDRDYDRP